MGIESFLKKPAGIKEAMRTGNSDALSRAGKKGAEVVNRNRDLITTVAAAEAERVEAQRAAEDEAMRRASNEHIIDGDGNDQDFSEDNVG